MIRPCPTCTTPFDDYAAVYAVSGALPLEACTLCRLLDPARQYRRLAWVPPVSLHAALESAPPPIAPPPVSTRGCRWTREQALVALYHWVQAHHDRFPCAEEMDRDPFLPTSPTARKLWGSVPAARVAFQRRYPGLGLQRRSPTRDRRWTRRTTLAACAQWVQAHGGHFPRAEDMDLDPLLPTSPTVRKLWGSVPAACVAFQARYAGLSLPQPPLHTRESVLAAVQAWLVAHPGQVPLAREFTQDPSLPPYHTVYRYIGALRTLYEALEARGVPCVALYDAAAAAARSRATAAGHGAQRQRKQAVAS